MKILVCVKQVLDTPDSVAVENGRIISVANRAPIYRMNRFDEFAVTEAVLIKGKIPGTTVDVVSAGPPPVESTLKRAIGMGADNGIRIDIGTVDVSPMALAKSIAKLAADRDYDLILTGLTAEDTADCMIGQATAEILAIACATFVSSIEIDIDNRCADVEREISSSDIQCIRIKLPAVLTVQAGINQPGYPRLSNMLRSEKAIIEVTDYSRELEGQDNTEVVSAQYPERNSAGMILEGDRTEKVKALKEILSEKRLLI